MAFYLQHGNINYFDTGYWAQVTQLKNYTILQSYLYLISGKNENLIQLLQFIAYIVSMISVYGISRKIGFSKYISITCSLLFSMLTENILQSNTTQNDMLIAAFTGISVYFLFVFRENKNFSFLILSAVSIGIAIGTKSSYILIFPLVILISTYIIFQSNPKNRGKILIFFIVAIVISIAAFALPSGYSENYKKYSNPFGPKKIIESHSFSGKPLPFILTNGTKNVFRFFFDFFSLDGMPPTHFIYAPQIQVKALIGNVITKMGVNLEDNEATRQPFSFQKHPTRHEDSSYFGILGFSLIFFALLISLLKWRPHFDCFVLSVSAFLFFLVQSYSGYYDPWRGRYFISMAVFAVPVTGILLKKLEQKSIIAHYIAIIVFVGCISAMSTVLFRDNSYLMSVYNQKSIFSMKRIEMLTRNQPAYIATFEKFESIVPKNSIVAVAITGDTHQYQLFGHKLTRTIIPVYSFMKGNLPIPINAEYLLYEKNFLDNKFYIKEVSDVYLGNDLFLRNLKI